MTGDSPVTNTITMLDVHTTEEGAIDLDEQGFFFAFGVKNYQRETSGMTPTWSNGKLRFLKEMERKIINFII